jgi:hypothetical protein
MIGGISLVDILGALIGFVLTIFIFSYLWGDNTLFRIATYLFIGVTAGYVSILIIQNVILPQLLLPFTGDDLNAKRFSLIFLILSALMLTKISPRLKKIGNPAVAYLVGVGAAAAIGGAVVGTLSPQTSASINVFVDNNLINGFVILLGTLTTLIYFQFGVRRKQEDTGNVKTRLAVFLEGLGWIGQNFIAITLGALFSGVYLAAITALVERLTYLWNLIVSVPTFF